MNPDLKILLTEDGSHTLFSTLFNSSYHSMHGAIQESAHIFIKEGLTYLSEISDNTIINILETGFGTGLNAFLSLQWALHNKKIIHYTGLEKYPVKIEMADQLNYPDLVSNGELSMAFKDLHHSNWGEEIQISPSFALHKIKIDLNDFDVTVPHFDLIYLDIFDPGVQAEFWEEAFLNKLYSVLNKNGVLITYGAKGSFKRALKHVGFEIQERPGPPGKREITRAIKSV